MKIIIVGAGDVGTHLAKMLSNENHDIVVIDLNEDKLKFIDSNFDLLTVVGSSTSFQTLKDANVKRCDLFIAVTESEDANIVSAILAKKLGAQKVIARIDNQEYLQPTNRSHFLSLGIDSIIYPERLAAKEIVALLNQSGTTEYVDFSGGKLSLYVVKLDSNAPIINKTLLEAMQMHKGFEYRAVAISRKGETIIPRGSDVFRESDTVYVITNRAGSRDMLKYAGKKNISIKNIMILGGSRIGMRTAKALEGHTNIKLIEIDKDKSFKLADILNNTLVINGDGRNTDLLEEEGLKNMDAFIAVTGDSETNIISCIMAKKMGVKRTIAEIENLDYINIAENMGIDTVINKKLITASNIFRFTMNAEVSSIRCLTGSDAEVLEFVAKPNSKSTSAPLRELDFPKDAIVGGIIRGNTSFIAKGDTQIRDNDRVVVFSLPEALSKIEHFFN